MRRKLLLAVLMVLSQLAPSGFAAEDTSKSSAVSKEERQARAEKHEKMAEMHRKMAECLRSDKALNECYEQMRKDCPMMKDGGHCPMMDEMNGMGMGKGRGRGRGMKMERNDDSQKQKD
jgi:hypothetical protein